MRNPAIKMTVVRSDPSHVQFLNSLNDVDGGVVSFRIRPGDQAHFGIIAYDIMAAMGARDDVSGPARNSSENPLHLPVWLAAHKVTDVIVCGAEAAAVEVVQALAETAFLTRARFWFLFDHEVPERLLEALGEWRPCPVDQKEFDSYWTKRAARSPDSLEEGGGEGNWPRQLPHEEFPMFLAEVRRQLPNHQADVVESEFRATVAIARKAIGGLGDVTEEALASVLRAHLTQSVHPAQALTRVRAFQVAAFHEGFLLKVDHAALLAGDVARFNKAVSDSETWRLLRSYRQPFRGAVNACLAAAVDVEDVPALRIGDVSEEGAVLTLRGRHVDVPPQAAVFLRALRLQRFADGAGTDDPLFYDYSKGPQQPFLLVRALNAAARELGVGLVTSRLKRHGGKARSWQTRHGVVIEKLRHRPRASHA